MRGETRVFELLLTGAKGHYTATPVTASGPGPSVNFTLPEELALARVSAGLDRVLRNTQFLLLGSGKLPATTPEEFGRRLAEAVLVGDVAYLLRRERKATRGALLLILLDIQSPELAALPWEFLWDVTSTPRGFLGTARGVTIVRKTPGVSSVPAPPVELPLRVKVMVASPRGLPTLALQHEVELLKEALAKDIRDGRVMIEEVAGQTADDLYAALKPGRDPVHVFHFAGHGDFDEASGEGQIILCDAQGDPKPLRASQLGSALDRSGMRFLSLNCGHGATNSRADLFSGVASRTAAQGIPAVLAMQYPIEDTQVVDLAARMYAELAAGRTIAESLNETRVAMSVGGLAWGTPVLYLNGEDRALVTSPSSPPPPPPPPLPPPPPPLPTLSNTWSSVSGVLGGVARLAAAGVIRSIRRGPTTPPSSVRLDAPLPRLTVYRSSWWAPRTDISLYVAVALPGAESEARAHALAAIDRPGNAMRESQSLPVPRVLRDQELLRCELDASFVTVKRATPRRWSAPCTVLVISAVVDSDAPLGEHQVTLQLFGQAESDTPAAPREGDELLAEVVFRVEVREVAPRAENPRRTAGALLSAAGAVGLVTLVLQHGEVPMVAQAAASGTALVGGIVVLANAEAPVAPTAVVPAGAVSVLYDRPDAAYALLAFDALQRSGLVAPAPASQLFSDDGTRSPSLRGGCVVIFWSRRARASRRFLNACAAFESRLRSGERQRVIVVSLDHDLPDSTSALSRAPRFTLPLAPVAEDAPRRAAGAAGAPSVSEDPFVKFDLEVTALAGGSYSVVLAAGQGWAKTPPQVTAPPICRCELMRAVLRCQIAAETRSGVLRDAVAVKLIQKTTCHICGMQRGSARDGEERPQAPQLALGRELAEMIFRGEIAAHYHTAAADGRPVRVRLSLPDDLTGIPWEVMTAPNGNTALSLTGTAHVVRMASAPLLPHLRPGSTLRVLALGATPTDRPRLDVEGEEEWLDAALTKLQQAGEVERKWIGDGRWDLLHAALIAEVWDVFHFAGHGEVGEVSLCADDGTEIPLPAADLAQLLLGRGIRVVVLNCCKGAAGDEVDRVASTAKVLAERGVPAVVAMQSAISDRGAVDFARSFYLALAARRPIEDAVAEARRALARGDGEEWMTPVLYLNADDGRLLERA